MRKSSMGSMNSAFAFLSGIGLQGIARGKPSLQHPRSTVRRNSHEATRVAWVRDKSHLFKAEAVVSSGREKIRATITPYD